MKLSNKVFLIVGLGFIVLISVLNIFFRNNLLGQYNSLEIQRVENDTKRVFNFINNDVDNLNSVVFDYSMWDDTYNFMGDHNEEYIESNFKDLTTYNKARIGFLMFIDKNGSIVFKKNVDGNNTSDNLQNEDADELASIINTLSNENGKREIKGIVQIRNKTLLVAAQPIRKTNGTGEPRGMYVNVRFFNKSELSIISSNLGMSIESLPYRYSEISSSAANIENVYVKIQSSDDISGYGVVRDLFGNSVMLLKFDSDRVVYKQALKIVNYFIIVFILSILIFNAMILILINFLVVRKIVNIKNTINKVETEEDLSVNLCVKGNDEITELSVNFNKMFQRLRRARDIIHESERKYHLLFSNMAGSFAYNKIVTDENGVPVDFIVLEVNDALLKAAKMKAENIINKKVTEILPRLLINNPEIIDLLGKIALSGTSEKFEDVFIEEFNSWFSVIAYGTEKGYFAILLSDITEERRTQEKIIKLAYNDDLTGLPNRKSIIESIKRALNSKQSNFAILFLDLDNFKSINDSLGHNVGDFVLKQASSRLYGLKNDNITIGRLGGDEFIILQENIDSIAEAESLAIDINNVLKQAFMYNGDGLHIGASIGITIYPDDGSDVAALMRNSDIAMYAAKKNGGYGYKLYSKRMNESSLKDIMMESYLRKALELDQFILYLQPIMELHSMKISYAEVLIRWKLHGEILPPGAFLPLAKKIGEIVNIDNWVLSCACKYCKRLHEEGFENVSISVNVSFKQLRQENFAQRVKRALEDANLKPYNLCLEITEDEAMEDAEFTIDMLKQIKKIGVKISLDDFGTGYSSLSYVNKLPIDKLKIDRSLIEFIHKDQRNAEIIKALIVMAHGVNIKVVAEGIETEEQLNMLKDLNCDYVQGYYTGRPVNFESFIEKNK